MRHKACLPKSSINIFATVFFMAFKILTLQITDKNSQKLIIDVHDRAIKTTFPTIVGTWARTTKSN